MAQFAGEVLAQRGQRFDPKTLAAVCQPVDPEDGALLLDELRRAGMMPRSLG